MLEIFFQSLLIGYSGAIMPGSLLTYTIDRSIRQGVRAGLLISLGHAVLEFLIVILLLFGIGKYLGTELAKAVIGMLGGLVLGYFGISMLKEVYSNKISVNFKGGQGESGIGNLMAGGFVISGSNPYFVFWWAVVGLKLVISSYSAFGIIGVAIFYVGHILSDVTWYVFVSAVISNTRAFISLKIYRVIIMVLGFCLAGFGLSFIIGSAGYFIKF